MHSRTSSSTPQRKVVLVFAAVILTMICLTSWRGSSQQHDTVESASSQSQNSFGGLTTRTKHVDGGEEGLSSIKTKYNNNLDSGMVLHSVSSAPSRSTIIDTSFVVQTVAPSTSGRDKIIVAAEDEDEDAYCDDVARSGMFQCVERYSGVCAQSVGCRPLVWGAYNRSREDGGGVHRAGGSRTKSDDDGLSMIAHAVHRVLGDRRALLDATTPPQHHEMVKMPTVGGREENNEAGGVSSIRYFHFCATRDLLRTWNGTLRLVDEFCTDVALRPQTTSGGSGGGGESGCRGSEGGVPCLLDIIRRQKGFDTHHNKVVAEMVVDQCQRFQRNVLAASVAFTNRTLWRLSTASRGATVPLSMHAEDIDELIRLEFEMQRKRYNTNSHPKTPKTLQLDRVARALFALINGRPVESLINVEWNVTMARTTAELFFTFERESKMGAVKEMMFEADGLRLNRVVDMAHIGCTERTYPAMRMAFVGDGLASGLQSRVQKWFDTACSYCRESRVLVESKIFSEAQVSIATTEEEAQGLLQTTFQRDVLLYQPDIIVLCIGKNDALYGGSEVNAKTLKTNLRWILNDYLSKMPHLPMILCVTPMPMFDVYMEPYKKRHRVGALLAGTRFERMSTVVVPAIKEAIRDLHVANTSLVHRVRIADLHSVTMRWLKRSAREAERKNPAEGVDLYAYTKAMVTPEGNEKVLSEAVQAALEGTKLSSRAAQYLLMAQLPDGSTARKLLQKVASMTVFQGLLSNSL